MDYGPTAPFCKVVLHFDERKMHLTSFAYLVGIRRYLNAGHQL